MVTHLCQGPHVTYGDLLVYARAMFPKGRLQDSRREDQKADNRKSRTRAEDLLI